MTNLVAQEHKHAAVWVVLVVEESMVVLAPIVNLATPNPAFGFRWMGEE